MLHALWTLFGLTSFVPSGSSEAQKIDAALSALRARRDRATLWSYLWATVTITATVLAARDHGCVACTLVAVSGAVALAYVLVGRWDDGRQVRALEVALVSADRRGPALRTFDGAADRVDRWRRSHTARRRADRSHRRRWR